MLISEKVSNDQRRTRERMRLYEEAGNDEQATLELERLFDRARRSQGLPTSVELKEPGQRQGYRIGLADFDDDTGGLRPSELCILAGRSGMGKTALARQAMVYGATKKRPVLFVSLETSVAQLVARLLCSHAKVDFRKLRSGTLTDADFTLLEQSGDWLREASFQIDDRPDATIADIRHAARQMQKSGGLELVVVDYLQLVCTDEPKMPREQQVSRMTGQLKSLARQLEIPVLCLAQLNRQAEGTRGSKDVARPQLSHLRESGAIEQDADVVLFVHREDYDDDDPELQGKAELIVAKNRNGRTGTFPLTWHPETTTFRAPITFEDNLAPPSGSGPVVPGFSPKRTGALRMSIDTWREATELEPGLRHLEDMARGADGWAGWEQLKRKLNRMVGLDAREPKLRSARVYGICYYHLLKLWECGGKYGDRIHTEGLDEFGDPKHTASDHRLERRDYQRRERRRRRSAIA